MNSHLDTIDQTLYSAHYTNPWLAPSPSLEWDYEENMHTGNTWAEPDFDKVAGTANADAFIRQMEQQQGTSGEPGMMANTLIDDDTGETFGVTNDAPAEPEVDESEEVFEDEGTGELEAEEAGLDLAGGEIAGPLMALNQAVGQVASGIASGKAANFNEESQNNYNYAITHGHGIGYDSVAQQNLNNAEAASQRYLSMTNSIGVLGQAGLAHSIFDSPASYQSPQVTSYMAQDSTGQVVNAQSTNVINADSTIGTT